jgi:hypothetical protein
MTLIRSDRWVIPSVIPSVIHWALAVVCWTKHHMDQHRLLACLSVAP